MFYLKHKGAKLSIREDNVYTRCHRCGKEFHVDIQELLCEDEVDLCGTMVYCPDCSKEERESK